MFITLYIYLLSELSPFDCPDGLYQFFDEHVVWASDLGLKIKATSIQTVSIVFGKLTLVTQQFL